MNNTVMIAALAGLIGGAAGSLAVSSLSAPAQAAADTSMSNQEALLPTVDSNDGALADEVAKLRRANGELSLRLSSLESQRTEVPRVADKESGDAESLAALGATVAELAAALKNPQSTESAGLRSMVATALEEVQTAQSDERQLEREQREVDRIVDRMGDYTEKLGLDAIQRQSMQDHLIDASKQRNALFTDMRAGDMPREDIRAAFTTQREDSAAALGRILSPSQMETYSSMNDDRGGGFGGGGRGGRRGGN
jgi:chromosome segregation ATPase